MRWGILLVALLLLPAATALGAMPAETQLVFEPNAQDGFKLVILNDGKPNLVTIDARNGLSQYLDVNPVTLEFKDGETQKFAMIKINYPEKLPPGEHITDIFIKETPSEGTIGAAITLQTKLKVFSTFPGKFVRIKIPKKTFQTGKPDNFIIEAESLGKTDIKSSRAIIDMHEGEELIVTLTTEPEPLGAGQTKFYLLPWTPDVKSGSYRVSGHLEYDGEIASDYRFFDIGSQGIELKNVRIVNFLKGERIIFAVDIFNNWNALQTDVLVELEFRKDGLSMASSNSEVVSMQPYEEKSLTAYWFISEMEKGIYDMIVRIKQGTEFKEYTYPVKLNKNSLEIEGFETESGPDLRLFIALVAITGALLLGREILLHYPSKK